MSCQTAKILDSADHGIFISTACPTVVEYVEKYLPDLTSCLVNVASPLLALVGCSKTSSALISKPYSSAPGIAKKLEADRHPDLLSLSLSFSDLRQWLKDEDIDPATTNPGVFDVFTARKKPKKEPPIPLKAE